MGLDLDHSCCEGHADVDTRPSDIGNVNVGDYRDEPLLAADRSVRGISSTIPLDESLSSGKQLNLTPLPNKYREYAAEHEMYKRCTSYYS